MESWQTIPGETPIDPSGLRPSVRKAVHNRAQLNVVEAENIRLATVRYLAGVLSRRGAPFTVDWTLKVHKEMFGKVWLWAGRIRGIELNLGSPAWRVRTDLHDLMADLHCWEGSDMPLVEQAATLHYRAVHIHPFENGNGRWARMLANIWLKQHGGAITMWPEQGITDCTSPVRDEYIEALQQADQVDMNPLIELHKRYAEPPT